MKIDLRAWLAVLAALALWTPAASAATQCGNVGPWCNTSLSPDQRAQLLLSRLDQSQKISLLAGDDVLGVTAAPGHHIGTSDGIPGLVPTVNFTDGTNGIRQGSTTAMPDELAVAASFDPGLARADGAVVGNEARDKGNDVLYGPTLTVMRTPLAGRTFQALGEDPFLTSQMGVGLIDGIQSQGVIADANIYVANNQEGQDPSGQSGMPGSPLGGATVGSRYVIDANVDQRTLREIYLPPFEAAVKAGVGTVMCAYNLVNGTYNCENGPLLNGILKREWGFKGFVLSDYGADHDTIASLQNGLDFEPWPGAVYGPGPVTAALASGAVTQAQLDDHVRRYLRTLFAFGVFDRPAFANDDSQINKPAHAATAQRVEQDAITLLKNSGRVLPLSRSHLKSIAVIGKVANSFLTGGGSSAVTPFSSVTPFQGIAARAGHGVTVSYNDGSDPASAAALAKSSSVAVVVAASYETEGTDLQCLTLECPNAYGDQDSLIRQVAAANPRTIVVLETGGPVLTPWRGQVKGLLEAWYPGEQGGAAIAHVLFGDADPSGHLPVTFPASASQYPTAGDTSSYPGIANSETYKESVFVGYRWYDAHRVAPAFPFGFGLSYTRFAYRRLVVKPVAGGAVVRATVTNIGRRAGSVVPQLYLGLPALPGVPQPPAQLKGFARVRLAAGHAARVSFRIGPSSLSYWDTSAGGWRIAAGCYRVMVGGSSRDLPLRGGFGRGGLRCAGAARR